MLDRSPTPPSSDAVGVPAITAQPVRAPLRVGPTPLTPVPVTGRTGARPGY